MQHQRFSLASSFMRKADDCFQPVPAGDTRVTQFSRSRSATGWKPVYTTVRYLVVQPIALQKPFIAFGNVPIADCREGLNQPFAVMARVAKAAIQIPSLFSFT